MIIHMWMHWFWITTFSFKYFLFLLVQMISLSCISHPMMSEAGLLDNNISTHFDFHHAPNNSSQASLGVNITAAHEEEVNVTSVKISDVSSTASPAPQINKDNLTSQAAASSSEEPIFFEESPDSEDTYNGGSLDMFQYPLKKVTKFSQIKYGKLTAKPKTKEETAEEDKKVEAVKVVEEKVKINISVQEKTDEYKESSAAVDVEHGNSSKPTEPIITALVSVENITINEGNGTESGGEESPQVTTTVSSSSQLSTNTSEIAEVTEDPKDADLLKNDTLVIENKVEESVIQTTVEPFLIQNRVAAATSAQNFESNQAGLNAGSITGITLGILVIFSLFGAVSFVLYRRRYLNKPQVLQDKCSNLDSSGYIDDTSLREHSEEMYSLDNDSFLNSLEAMTIQNYWTESVKHTKL